MPIMQWNDSLDIGITAMNNGHKHILDAMNKIYDASKAGRAGEDINRMVAQLHAICVAHFTEEEAYMASIAYPSLSNHKMIHQDLLERYAQHAREIKAAGGNPDPKFYHFLQHWLTAHIKGIDRKYSDHAAHGGYRAA